MPNIFSTTDETQAGYFRIGFVVLQIPPTDISTNRVINDDQVSTLRGRSPMFVKTGQARWDITVRWKAIRVTKKDKTYDYSQWNDLQNIVAIFKAAPFVEVENAFLRQHFTNIQSAYKVQRMAFAMKQLRVDTNPDSVDTLDIVLTMSLFNFAPYSLDFSYVGGSGNAIDSTSFQAYIENWIAQNITNQPIGNSSPPLQNWIHQEAGDVIFKWRQYISVPITSPQPPTQNNASAGYTLVVPPTNVPKNLKTGKLTSDIQAIINTAAAKYGLDASIVTAQCLYESGGNPNANRGKVGVGLGLMQLVATTASQLGVTNVWDPTQNADGGCKYLAQMLTKFGNYPQALAAYNTGPAYVIAYSKGITQAHGTINPQMIKTSNGLPPPGVPHGENAPLYVNTILTRAGKPNLIVSTPIKSTSGSPPVTPTTIVLGDNPTPAFVKLVNSVFPSLPSGTWVVDHYTAQSIFFYQENEFILSSEDSPNQGDYTMYPNQVSVVMVNNLPLIPLAAMQYPTYQHVGPSDTMVSISFNSVGTTDTVLPEPEHGGIEALAGLSSQLEDQFHAMRTLFRKASSVHSMQSLYIQNQILNLLGIRGTMIRGITTETIPEAVDLVQVSLLVSQYENIFEDINPFIMNGIPKAYNGILKNILTSGQLNGLSKSEQNTLAETQQFATAWANKDPNFLLSQILSISAQPKLDFLSGVTTPDAQLNPSQKATLLANMDQATMSNLPGDIGGLFGAISNAVTNLNPALLTGQFQKDAYPGLEIRRQKLLNSTVGMTFADYFVFSQLPILANKAAVTTIRTTTEAKFSSTESNLYDTMYNSLFDWEILTNPLFAKEATSITNSPTFKAQFSSAAVVTGPATQKDNSGTSINPGHNCYKDLGLTDYNQTPADYFTDWNATLNTDINTELTNVLGTANQAANTVDASQSVLSSQSSGTQKTSDGYTFSANGQLLPGSANALIRQINVPAYSMNSCFPTFKLLLLEEDNTGPFFAFDNFYSYASVMDIEIIKYSNKPDTAIIKIASLSHILQHRLYDDTAAGKMEKQADKFNIDPSSGLVVNPDGSVDVGTGGNPTAGISAGKTASSSLYQFTRVNMTEGRNEAWTRVPLRFYALQTGSKIQIRMGYSNNPDNLFPVFTGIVTNIEGDDILILTCQDFTLELMNIPGTLVQANSLLGFNFLSGGAAFGGYSICNPSGDTTTVMRTLLRAPTAKHFGHWQIGGQTDPMIKGFSWSQLLGDAMSNASNSTIQKVGALLQTGYDRSGENILVNSINNFDATKTEQDPANAGSRTFDNENPYLLLGTAQYSIPNQSTMSLWDIIKDVARRYPHYNLIVKDYGFPYGADATLVYAHPLDWYYSRPRLLGDAEQEKPNDFSQGATFVAWWSSVGSASWEHIFNVALPSFFKSLSINPLKNAQTANASLVLSQIAAIKEPFTALAGSGPEGFNDATQYMHQILTGTFDPNSSASAIGSPTSTLEKIGLTILDFLNSSVSNGNLSGGIVNSVDENFLALYREWLAYLQLSDPAANSSRLRPVRKYHLIDHNHIVHNGMIVNDNIYNAVKIKDQAPVLFNQNIPDQHIRCLDVTDQINDPDHNVLIGDGRMANAYAQSFLREEVGKMYQGELILRGVPEIEPYDIILLNDLSTGTVGPIEVDTVIHSFNLEDGYITIVKPKLMLVVNESVSLSVMQNLGFAWANAGTNLHGLGEIFNPKNPNVTISALAIEAAAGGGIVIAAVGAVAWCPPAAIIIGSLALLSGAGILMYAYAQSRSKDNFFQLMPLSRFGRPWIGGLQGFAISDFAYSLGQSFKWFDAEEISPTIESWNELMNFRGDYLLQQ